MLDEFSDVFTDVPGRSNIEDHKVKLTSDEPVRSKPYPLPYVTKQQVADEVDKMLKMGVVEKSVSPFASPIVLVRKPDGTLRFCIDYRRLNAQTVFDVEPQPIPEDLFAKLHHGKYFSKLDMAKGYWQIPLDENACEKSAFVTTDGHYEFKVMPFGMVNAAATFTRVMRKLLAGIDDLVNLIDDILIYTETWEKHLEVLREVLTRIRKANMTIRPTKCHLGLEEIEFLGHVVGKCSIKPVPEKTRKILEATEPVTKKELRSFLGLAGYYRQFIPDFAAVAVPLTDLTRKGSPNRLPWRQIHQIAFNTLKRKLSSDPILKLPDFSRTFHLRTDASDVGIGAVLLQEYDGEFFPIEYASRKLLPRERNYAVIERECLAVVWAVKKFASYLHGQPFVIETDHEPLAYISKVKLQNPRVMRWALSLQPYRFTVKCIKGSDNLGADYLSRI